MEWSAAGAPLVATRAVHFAATVITVGDVIFRTFIAGPLPRSEPTASAAFPTLRVSWLGLVVSVFSGAIWLLLQAASMSGLPLGEALTADVMSTVINETQFGTVTVVRAGLVICLAACLACDRALLARWLGLAAALAFVASLAWTGHAGSTIGAEGYLHLVADALHLIAAAAWIGGLVSLVLLLWAAHRSKAIAAARHAVGRFSILGIVSVAVLLLTGTVNTVILVGSPRGLIFTNYGQLLLVKLGLFAVMLGLAAVNRFRLTPELASSGNEQSLVALRRLIRNSVIETACGLSIIAIVGVLGTLHPAVHLVYLTTSR